MRRVPSAAGLLKMSCTRCCSLLVLGLLVGCAHAVRDDLRGPLTIDELAGTWIGHDPTGTHFYYLVLRSDGSGLLGSLYNQVSLVKYPLSWHPDGDKLEINADWNTGKNPPLLVAASSRGFDITLKLRASGWRQTATLLRKGTVEKEIRIVEEALRDGD